jgi:hypothetical protein
MKSNGLIDEIRLLAIKGLQKDGAWTMCTYVYHLTPNRVKRHFIYTWPPSYSNPGYAPGFG